MSPACSPRICSQLSDEDMCRIRVSRGTGQRCRESERQRPWTRRRVALADSEQSKRLGIIASPMAGRPPTTTGGPPWFAEGLDTPTRLRRTMHELCHTTPLGATLYSAPSTRRPGHRHLSHVFITTATDMRRHPAARSSSRSRADHGTRRQQALDAGLAVLPRPPPALFHVEPAHGSPLRGAGQTSPRRPPIPPKTSLSQRCRRAVVCFALH